MLHFNYTETTEDIMSTLAASARRVSVTLVDTNEDHVCLSFWDAQGDYVDQDSIYEPTQNPITLETDWDRIHENVVEKLTELGLKITADHGDEYEVSAA